MTCLSYFSKTHKNVESNLVGLLKESSLFLAALLFRD